MAEQENKEKETFIQHLRASTKRQVVLILTATLSISFIGMIFLNPIVSDFAQTQFISFLLFATNVISSYMGYSIATDKPKE